MKRIALVLIGMIALSVVSGCAQKTTSEKLRDDMNEAADKLDKEMKGFGN